MAKKYIALTDEEAKTLFSALVVAKIKASQEAIACAELQDQFPNLAQNSIIFALAEKYEKDATMRQSLLEKVISQFCRE